MLFSQESFQNCFTGSSHYFSQDCSATTIWQVVLITLDLLEVSFLFLGFLLFTIGFAVKEFINCKLSDSPTLENYLSWPDKL